MKTNPSPYHRQAVLLAVTLAVLTALAILAGIIGARRDRAGWTVWGNEGEAAP